MSSDCVVVVMAAISACAAQTLHMMMVAIACESFTGCVQGMCEHHMGHVTASAFAK